MKNSLLLLDIDKLRDLHAQSAKKYRENGLMRTRRILNLTCRRLFPIPSSKKEERRIAWCLALVNADHIGYQQRKDLDYLLGQQKVIHRNLLCAHEHLDSASHCDIPLISRHITNALEVWSTTQLASYIELRQLNKN